MEAYFLPVFRQLFKSEHITYSTNAVDNSLSVFIHHNVSSTNKVVRQKKTLNVYKQFALRLRSLLLPQ